MDGQWKFGQKHYPVAVSRELKGRLTEIYQQHMLIRKATSKDSEAIATHLLLAMEDIVYKFIGSRDPEEARKFMLHFAATDNNQYSYQNCWIVQDEDEVVATINLYDGGALHQLRQPVLGYLKARFNRELTPEDETQAGEWYIDSLGVDVSRQGNGIGSALLQYVVDEYTKKNNQTLGLLVDKENTKARRLYIRLGFKSAGTKFLFGKQLEHLQIKG
jgi:ribosomal protein S18 acetylase RimI-like enzyme